MITAIAIDDEPLGLEVIKEYCSKTDFIQLTGTFTRAGKALEYLHQCKTDLLFLDIEMPLISGLDFFKKVPAGTAVIFTTAYSQYAIDGFELSAIDFLLKPFDYPRFVKAVEKARDHFRLRSMEDKTDHLLIKIDHGIRKVYFADIQYVEGQDNYVKIHLENGRYHLVRMAMKALLQQMPGALFTRVHKSYIVPRKKVTAYRNRNIYIGTVEIPTSGLYMDDVNRIFGGGSST